MNLHFFRCATSRKRSRNYNRYDKIFFKTKKGKYVFIDAPGHKEFIKNMITGASSADIAILIVDVNEGIKQQTKKHAYLLKLLGINRVICLFNKMDMINYNQLQILES